MSERDFEAGGKKFKLNKIDVFKQYHIARRLGPIMGDIFAIAPKLKDIKEDTEEKKLEAAAQIAKPLLDGFAKLSDADADLVLLGLCSAVEVHQPQSNSWARVARDGVFMFQDLDLPTLLQVAGRSFLFNIGSFFNIAQQTSHGGK
jgi:hypothetical protein